MYKKWYAGIRRSINRLIYLRISKWKRKGMNMKEAKKKDRQKRILKERNVGRDKKMVKCPFCYDNDKTYLNRNKIVEHLIVTKDSTQHFHVHGPISNTELMKDFILMIAKEANIEIENEG